MKMVEGKKNPFINSWGRKEEGYVVFFELLSAKEKAINKVWSIYMKKEKQLMKALLKDKLNEVRKWK